ncbi:protein MIS12-like [Quillaja saponaria]|uniref:Protein MIS12-like n=1 Tax=Quillaja saponaria TaxID=32244 RepID=A0AAD7QC48_QUISA|nr:protein MIS12-like [Quillaja saponaria]KAJ7978807.1 protein MIS12-like [Quillaja saponaria]
MEGSKSEAIFDSLNLNPKLFINEVLNTVDDVVDDAFNYYYQEASAKLKTDGTEKSQDLKQGVDSIRNRIQSVLDKRLAIWEKYCLHHCFAVPEGFLPKNDESPVVFNICQDALCDPDLDVQLDSLRQKLSMVGKESEMLSQELQELERHSTSINQCAGAINEALQLYEQNPLNEMFQEIVTTASELGIKMGKLKTSMIEEIDNAKTKSIYKTDRNFCTTDEAKGLSNAKLEDLLEFLAVMKNI